MTSADDASPLRVRLVSLDAYRGFVMLFMASSIGAAFKSLADRSMEPTTWDRLHQWTDHARWAGCTPWDLIQPAFMFIVGAAMPFSDANRQAAGQSWPARFRHALARSAVLIVLGVFLASNGAGRTNFSFMSVLAQIGLAYPFVFLLLGRNPRVQFLAAGLILFGDWALFALYPQPESPAEFLAFQLPPDWVYQADFLGHWEKNSNIGARFDVFFLNQFPRPVPFRGNDGGYVTINFIPSIVTMLIGVLAGGWLRSSRTGREKILGLVFWGAVCLIAGRSLGMTVCPIVKRLWTPSWVLFSASWTLWLLALFYGVIDLAGWKRWAFPFVVVGMNPLFMYMLAQLTRGWTRSTIAAHANTLLGWLHQRFGANVPLEVFGGPYGSFVASIAVLAAWWAVCYWLYRRRIFIRV